MRVWVLWSRGGAEQVTEHDTLAEALDLPELKTATARVVRAGRPTDVIAEARDGAIVLTRAGMWLSRERLPPRVPSATELM